MLMIQKLFSKIYQKPETSTKTVMVSCLLQNLLRTIHAYTPAAYSDAILEDGAVIECNDIMV